MTRFASPQAAALAQLIDPQMAAGGGPSQNFVPTLANLIQAPGRRIQDLGESGGIYPRLGSLSSNIDSAEQELQGINQSIDSLQSQIGQPSGGQISPLQTAEGVGPRIPLGLGPAANNFVAPYLLGPRPAVDAPGGMQSNPGDPRLGATQIPGNELQMIMRNMAANGGSMNVVPREQYGLGSFIKKAIKGVKKIVKSPLGKAALLGIGAFGLPGGALGMKGFMPTNLRSLGGIGKAIFGTGLPVGSPEMGGGTSQGILGMAKNFFGGKKTLGKTAAMFGLGSLGGGALAALEASGVEDPSQVRDVEALKIQLANGYKLLNPEAEQDEVDAFVQANTAEYRAEGGRIGYGNGSEDYGDLIDAYERGIDVMPGESLTDYINRIRKSERKKSAMGGKMEQNAIKAAGIEGLPLNQNPAGVTELDLRDSGGFIPPVGVKEKADDIPAMLANNEFVFTADAVRGMGDGNVNKGAQRMYDMMKKLEKGGKV
jgi:hypothetical protein